ncbi:DUF6932 family protein [Prosthecobacter dejongeii]|uniref:Uncharacterized protein n=1 Tax=Prosthecobacter dejongeii TaxID=48465 RepID=A0A7W8DRU9_9BACT|nr:hypothetical protein [Prosthecobacter dejongeii]MBB5040279.1 hypothetical protein [Prosthecobacter dejongeii]
MPIPAFDHNGVIPPHLGDPTVALDVSPYPCTTVDLVKRFATSTDRCAILNGLLQFRNRLRQEGLINAFQWLDGSFLEDIEAIQKRPPRDLDVVTFYWGYDRAFQQKLFGSFPEAYKPVLAKASFKLDHYSVDAGYHPKVTVEQTRYWSQLFSHNRTGVWKGMLKLEVDTALDDAAALTLLKGIHP